MISHGTYFRWQSSSIEAALKTRRVVYLSGARQGGKSTLTQSMASIDRHYRTLDDLTLKQAAENDPQDFVHHDIQTLIIDEAQRVPLLLPAIKMAVDSDRRPGRFLLTGSVNIQSLPGVQESLAGRITNIRLRPLSQGEITSAEPAFLDRLFDRRFPTGGALFGRDEILSMALRGGFPEAITLKGRDRGNWHRDYITALIERDLRDITRIQRHGAMKNLVQILAAWSSKLMDISAIGTGLSIARPTLESYINALEMLYLIERVPPWTKTDYGRVGKHAKLFMTDSGLMASILNWGLDALPLDPDRSGKLVETFAFNEIAAQVDANNGVYALYHYRDREKREIDFLVEREDGALLGLEVKAGTTVRNRDFQHLEWFRDNLVGKRRFTGIVLYSGDHAVSFGPDLWALPIGTMWS